VKRQLRTDAPISIFKKFSKIELSKSSNVLILSDLHLGLDRKEIKSNFIELVKMIKYINEYMKPDLIILLGDILELWQAKVYKVLETAYAFFRELFLLNKPVIYISGNHDRIISSFQLKGVEGQKPFYLVSNYLLIYKNGKKILALHGHQFDRIFTVTLGLWKIESFIYAISESLISLPGLSEWFISLLALSIAALIIIFSLAFNISLILKISLLIGSLLLSAPFLVLVWRHIQSELWYILAIPLSINLPLRKTKHRELRAMIKTKGFTKFLEKARNDIGKIDCLVFGHTHSPGIVRLEKEDLTVVNCGSWVSEVNKDDASVNTFVWISENKIKLFRWKNKIEKVGEVNI